MVFTKKLLQTSNITLGIHSIVVKIGRDTRIWTRLIKEWVTNNKAYTFLCLVGELKSWNKVVWAPFYTILTLYVILVCYIEQSSQAKKGGHSFPSRCDLYVIIEKTIYHFFLVIILQVYSRTSYTLFLADDLTQILPSSFYGQTEWQLALHHNLIIYEK